MNLGNTNSAYADLDRKIVYRHLRIFADNLLAVILVRFNDSGCLVVLRLCQHRSHIEVRNPKSRK